MKRQYAISLVLQKDFHEGNQIRQAFNNALRCGTMDIDESNKYDECKEVAIEDLLKDDKEVKDFIKKGYSIFISTFHILPLIAEENE